MSKQVGRMLEKRFGPGALARAKGRKLNRRQKKQVKRIVGIQQEKKYWPVYAGYTAFSPTGTVTPWSLIPVGDTASTRDGDQIRITEIDVRFAMNQANTGGAASGVGRIIIFQYRRDNTGDPITATVLDTGFTQPVFAPAPLPNNQQGIKILYDKSFALNNATAGPSSVVRHIRLRNMNKKLVYNQATRGYNQLYVLVLSDSAINQPTWAYGGYIRFTDS